MKNYYQELNISEDSSDLEIKRAYFSLVREYPPDRFAKEFMIIRKAYETLINKKSREHYDKINSIPDEFKEYYNQANNYILQGEVQKSISYLEKVIKFSPQ